MLLKSESGGVIASKGDVEMTVDASLDYWRRKSRWTTFTGFVDDEDVSDMGAAVHPWQLRMLTL